MGNQGRSPLSLEVLGENPSCLVPLTVAPGPTLVYGHVTLISASAPTWAFSPCLVSHRDTCHWIWGPPG